ncbi:MAG: hypothetical protein RKR03_02670, partial [Candidatus Competibacter sp.]|nr:hypothetical protein [Candidatus Competibacter sp.]
MRIQLQQITALCTLLFCLVPYASADCGYQLKYVAPESASRDYALSEIRNFVVSEVRPKLSQTERRDWIKITRNCNGATSNVGLQIQTDDYYLTNVDGFEVGEDVYKYDEQNLEISKERFGYYFSAAEAFQQKTKDEQRRILKYFAYIFAESARFAAIEERLDDLFLRDCRVNWAESKRLFRRWARLSKVDPGKWTRGLDRMPRS